MGLLFFLSLSLVCLLAWSVGEALCRERRGEKLAAFDALFRRDWANATVARSALVGTAAGLAARGRRGGPRPRHLPLGPLPGALVPARPLVAERLLAGGGAAALLLRLRALRRAGRAPHPGAAADAAARRRRRRRARHTPLHPLPLRLAGAAALLAGLGAGDDGAGDGGPGRPLPRLRPARCADRGVRRPGAAQRPAAPPRRRPLAPAPGHAAAARRRAAAPPLDPPPRQRAGVRVPLRRRAAARAADRRARAAAGGAGDRARHPELDPARPAAAPERRRHRPRLPAGERGGRRLLRRAGAGGRAAGGGGRRRRRPRRLERPGDVDGEVGPGRAGDLRPGGPPGLRDPQPHGLPDRAQAPPGHPLLRPPRSGAPRAGLRQRRPPLSRMS